MLSSTVSCKPGDALWPAPARHSYRPTSGCRTAGRRQCTEHGTQALAQQHGAPLRDAQLGLERAQLAPEALVGVDQAAAAARVLPRALGRPREAAHEVRDHQRRRAADARTAVHQHG